MKKDKNKKLYKRMKLQAILAGHDKIGTAEPGDRFDPYSDKIARDVVSVMNKEKHPNKQEKTDVSNIMRKIHESYKFRKKKKKK